MIGKHALGPRPDGWVSVFLQLTNAERVCAEIMLKQKSEKRDDSSQSHSALERFPAMWAPVRVKKTPQNKKLEPPFRSNRNGKDSKRRCCWPLIISSECIPTRSPPVIPAIPLPDIRWP